MAQKTKPSNQSVEDFLSQLENESVRDDCHTLIHLMRRITKSDPVLWGGSIIGFGKYHYKYESGHEGYSCLTGFSPRKEKFSIYIMPGYTEQASLTDKLGKFKMGKGCLYVKKLSDIDMDVLEEIVKKSVETLKQKYPSE